LAVVRSAKTAARFQDQIDRAVAEIGATPDRWSPHLYGTRAFKLRKFPYLVVYLPTANVVQVIAVAHGLRRPGYWRRRLP
jgi:toxin ParE1/3/4